MSIRAGALVALVACTHEQPTVSLVDARIDAAVCGGPSASTCNPIEQLGCNADERCTWLPSRADPGCGSIGCTNEGQRSIGESCAYVDGPVVSYDDCARGGVCVRAICRAICDVNGGTTTCPGAETCTADAVVFRSNGRSVAGICE